jgi:hypothetical protein
VYLYCRESGSNWIITDLNPAGDFNLETGGDQFYFLQNGTWNGGTVAWTTQLMVAMLYGFTTPVPAADGTTHQSNLHPDVAPCLYVFRWIGVLQIHKQFYTYQSI